MSKLKKLRSFLGLITYLPELIAGFSAGILTALYITARNLIPMLPEICRAMGRFFLASFKAFIIALGIFAVANFLFGGPITLPVLIATALCNGTFSTLPVLIQHSFAFVFAASLANFRWNLETEDFTNGHERFVFGLVRFWAPAISLTLEVIKIIALGLNILEPKKKQTIRNIRERIKDQMHSVGQEIATNMELSEKRVTELKQNASDYINNSEFMQTVYRKLAIGYERFILTPGRWLGLVQVAQMHAITPHDSAEEITSITENVTEIISSGHDENTNNGIFLYRNTLKHLDKEQQEENTKENNIEEEEGLRSTSPSPPPSPGRD